MVAAGGDHKVTPAELFFDLVFVYAITQVTALMAAHPSPVRVVGAMTVLALLWWCWCAFAWLGNVVRADSGALFAVLVTVMTVVFVVSLAVPEVFADAPGGLPAPVVFVVCYGLVRTLHLVSYWVSSPGDTALRATLRRTALLSVAPPFVLLLMGCAYDGPPRLLLGAAAIVLRCSGPRPTALLVGGVCCLAAGPLVALVPALLAMALLAAAVTALVTAHDHRARAAAAG